MGEFHVSESELGFQFHYRYSNLDLVEMIRGRSSGDTVETLLDEAVSWCAANLGRMGDGRWHLSNQRIIFIAQPEDAVLFKLRWM